MIRPFWAMQVMSLSPGMMRWPWTGTPITYAISGRSRPTVDLKALIEAKAPDLHLAVWNPYAVLDVPAPALITYGFRAAALDAIANWMAGRIEAEGTLPIVILGALAGGRDADFATLSGSWSGTTSIEPTSECPLPTATAALDAGVS